MPIVIAHLADHPAELPTVAEWIYRQWGQRPGNTAEATEERLASHMKKGQIPLMLLALDDATCVGCASLRDTDLPDCDDIGPWLASLYVPEIRRREGIGAKLVRAIEAEAEHLGFSELYLFTSDQARFYARLGWEMLETRPHHGSQVSVMRKTIRVGRAGVAG